MTTDTTTARTIASLQDGDRFTFQPELTGVCTLVVYGDGTRHYRGAYGQTHPLAGSDESQAVYNVQTEAEATAAYNARLEAERAAERVRASAFYVTMQAVAKALGKGWKAEKQTGEDSDRWCRVYLNGPQGEKVWATAGYYHQNKGRTTISGILERSQDVRAKFSDITVAQDKTAERIAGDITRRLLPDYRVALAESVERKTKADAYAEKTKATMWALVKATKKHSGRTGHDSRVWSTIADMVAQGEEVTFERLRMSLPVALEVLKVLSKHATKGD